MTPTSSSPIDHPVDPSADLPKQTTQSPEPSATATPTEENSNIDNDNTNGKENINPLGEISGNKTTAGHDERDQGLKQDEIDDFGLPIRGRNGPVQSETESSGNRETFNDVQEASSSRGSNDKWSKKESHTPTQELGSEDSSEKGKQIAASEIQKFTDDSEKHSHREEAPAAAAPSGGETGPQKIAEVDQESEGHVTYKDSPSKPEDKPSPPSAADSNPAGPDTSTSTHAPHEKRTSLKPSEWSHQRLSDDKALDSETEEESDVDWKDMPALGQFDVYDDFGRLVARGAKEEDDEAVYQGLGGAGKGYTRVQLDEDAQSATSLDEDTSYLFKEKAGNSSVVVEGDELRDPGSQLQATKDLLTESQRIAYVGVVRLTIYQMTSDMEELLTKKATRKTVQKGIDATRKWGQLIMGRIYSHMEIDAAEQVMIEQLAEHGVQPADLVRPLMQNARVKNPLADDLDSPKASMSSTTSPSLQEGSRTGLPSEIDRDSERTPPPPYEIHEGENIPEVRTPSQMPTTTNIDLDLRWTVLCDLFLVLIADSVYDARSRTLLERVGKSMEVSLLQITRFEKRVIDALEMQEAAEKETWDESEHMEKRRKMALTRKYMVMGLATVGGGLIIGLSAGLLAPIIGAGLAAGFTTVGISGTGAFLGGAGGTALIASGATLTGSTIGMKASHRRTGAVQTFEYRPLHNNKRVNLIVTVSGWMTGKVDDVRLPFSTVDPIMGDIYSVLWEPEMLRSMGDTINILATEALTQGLQQVLGSTVLMALMASLQLPLVLTKLSYLIDNPWNVSLARANASGLILADSLMDHNLGQRPVTLLGFSLGARVIFSCLKELADKGAHGLVQNVYLFGSPLVANKDEYLKARSVVSGRFVNGYSSNDWILGYLFRATAGGIMGVAGLAPIEGIPGLENIDVTKLVNGHMDYRKAIPRLLKEVGWEVISEDFAEIEDPDPENHAERQRELIREIDEARREAEAKPDKKRFGIFKRGNLAKKKGWETYDVNRNNSPSWDSVDNNGVGTVLFDIDAIRAELASEMIEVKQLESTLPPMKLDLSPSSQSPVATTPSDNKQTKEDETISPAPQLPAEPSSSYFYPHPQSSPHGEEEINMTFGTSYDDLPQRSHSSFEPTSVTRDIHPTRPGLRSSSTTPATVSATPFTAIPLEPNAWAEHDFGHQGDDEIQMTFE